MTAIRQLIAALGATLERLDDVLRTWEVAGLSLLLLALALADSIRITRRLPTAAAMCLSEWPLMRLPSARISWSKVSKTFATT